MVSVAERTLREVDLVLWLVEPTTFIGAGERHIAEQLNKIDTPVILVINKIDTVSKAEILKFIDAYKDIVPFKEIIPVSALKVRTQMSFCIQCLNIWKKDLATMMKIRSRISRKDRSCQN